jgi:methyl-accepting chemotaxis protein
MQQRAVSLSARLWATALLALIGSIALLFISLRTINDVKIRGPLYQDIVSYKDLLADILPPPAYLIESYLTCFELMKAKDGEQADLIKKLGTLEADYKDRHAFWLQELKNEGLRQSMLEQSTAPALEFFFRAKKDFIPAIQQGNLVAAQAALDGPLTTAYKQHRAAIDKTVELANKEVGVVEATADVTLSSSIRSLFLYAAVINILVLLLTFYSIRSIMTPMRNLIGYAKRVSDGDYDCVCEIQAQNEIGNLAQTLSTTVSKVKEGLTRASESEQQAQVEAQKARISTANAEEAKTRAEQAKQQGMLLAASKLEKVVEIVGSASEQLAAQIDQSTKGAQAQARKSSAASTAMTEMNSSVLEVAQNASRTAETSTQAQAKAIDGAKVVKRVMESIEDVQTSAATLKEQMKVLGKQSEGIGQILSVISDIADQTNLLALNAAIEAARAGDAGRGFAVVADEVRKLAEKTMSATRQVDEAIKGVQASAHGNITLVDQAVQSITEATQLSELSGQALNDIVRLVKAASDQVRGIATEAEHQSLASEEISQAVLEVTTVAQQTSASMNDASRAVFELSRQAGDLRNLIQELKTDAQG